MFLDMFVFLKLSGYQMEVIRKRFKMALGCYFVIFVTFKGGKLCKHLRLKMF